VGIRIEAYYRVSVVVKGYKSSTVLHVYRSSTGVTGVHE